MSTAVTVVFVFSAAARAYTPDGPTPLSAASARAFRNTTHAERYMVGCAGWMLALTAEVHHGKGLVCQQHSSQRTHARVTNAVACDRDRARSSQF
jgi:hypothetical protein